MDADIKRAASLIRAGGLVAMPTETVYGLAADATNDEAVARIYAAKERPAFNPLIVHVADAAMARACAEFPPLAERLAASFWPGPLTLVLRRRPPPSPSATPPPQAGEEGTRGGSDAESEAMRVRQAPSSPACGGGGREAAGGGPPISHLVTAGLDTIGLRAPAHAVAQALIRESGRPLAAPSANRSGEVSPTTAAHVRESLGPGVFVLDGGPARIGVESAIVKIDGARAILLRPGGVARAAIERVTGPLQSSAGGIEAPGMLARHYAPRARLRLDARAPREGEAFLGFGAAAAPGPFALNLSEKGDLVEAAANLFSHLRALDARCAAHGLSAIAVAPIPRDGLGEAINDRLRRGSKQ